MGRVKIEVQRKISLEELEQRTMTLEKDARVLGGFTS